MAKCKVCGSRVPDGTAQCPMCGAKIAAAQGSAQSPVQPTPQAKPAQPAASAQPVQPSSPAPQSAPASSGSKCKVCGNRIPLGSVSCPMCGAKVAGATPTPQTPPVQPWEQPQPQPAQPSYQPQPTQPQPTQPSYQPNPNQNPPKEKKGCLGKIITAIIVIIGIIIALKIFNSNSKPKEIPLDQYQVTTYRDYQLHPEKYYGKYVVFKKLCVSYLDRTYVVLYEWNTQTTIDTRIQHSCTGERLDWLAKKNNSFNHGYHDTVSLYCYIDKTGGFKPLRLEN